MINKIIIFDRKVSDSIRIHNTKSIKFRIAAVLAHSGDSWLWCAILFLFWIFAEGEKQKILAFWGISIAVTAVFIFFLKRLIPRKRPDGNWGTIYREKDPFSFPSGHAVRAGLIIMLGYKFCPEWLFILIVVWALMMILSRVATGVHFLLDITAGLLLGLLLGCLWIIEAPWIFTKFYILFDRSLWSFLIEK